MSAPVDVLAVMDRTIQLRAGFLPTNGAADLCGKIPTDSGNPITAAFIERHREAVEARAAVAELVEAVKLVLDGPTGTRHMAEQTLRAALAKFSGA